MQQPHPPSPSSLPSFSKGTLRPKTADPINGEYLNRLLDQLTSTVSSNHSTKISNFHDVNLIDQGLYLGDGIAAKDRTFLVRNGFTHVLNAAEGTDLYQVNTDPEFYSSTRIRYMGVPGHDRPSWNISIYFDSAARFIDNAIKTGGKVYVHCVAGISRSATLVLAYLMTCKNMNAAEALQYVFRRRRIFPNEGFLYHLAHLNAVLDKRSYHPFNTRRYY